MCCAVHACSACAVRSVRSAHRAAARVARYGMLARGSRGSGIGAGARGRRGSEARGGGKGQGLAPALLPGRWDGIWGPEPDTGAVRNGPRSCVARVALSCVTARHELVPALPALPLCLRSLGACFWRNLERRQRRALGTCSYVCHASRALAAQSEHSRPPGRPPGRLVVGRSATTWNAAQQRRRRPRLAAPAAGRPSGLAHVRRRELESAHPAPVDDAGARCWRAGRAVVAFSDQRARLARQGAGAPRLGQTGAAPRPPRRLVPGVSGDGDASALAVSLDRCRALRDLHWTLRDA